MDPSQNSYSYYNPEPAQYGSPPLGKRSPPPLQHPVPQHPIPNFNPAVHHHSSPSPSLPQQQIPQQQSYHYRQAPPPPHPQQGIYGQEGPSNVYSHFGFNEPAAQLGMQFAGNAVAQGQAYMERNVSQDGTMAAASIV